MKREEKSLNGMAQKLVFWFDTHQRDLPWRKTYSPYEIWISEIMLQQTQMQTVLPYFHRWMKRFPDIRSVAEAQEEELLKYWEGLGYYSRVRNIRKAALILQRDFDGMLPRDHLAVLNLPGIGPYTAGAIMSFAFNEEYPIVDGNVERVFARLFNIESPVKERASQTFIWKTARELIPEGKARPFNQALMELGSLVCLPRKPVCSICPVREYCESDKLGVAEKRPVPKKKKALVPIEVALGVLVDQGRVFIQKRPPSGLMAGLWEFPGGKVENGETPEEALLREFGEELEVKVECPKKITVIRHTYTSFKVTLHAFFCRFQGETQPPVVRAAVEGRWARLDQLTRYAFPAANRKLIRMLQERGLPE